MKGVVLGSVAFLRSYWEYFHTGAHLMPKKGDIEPLLVCNSDEICSPYVL